MEIPCKLILILIFILNTSFFSMNCLAANSQCSGSRSNGSIKGAIQIPVKGKNFVINHSFIDKLGRNYVHSKVYDVILDSYENLFILNPEIKFKYAETAWKQGGDFYPHKTHQNGLSVDFMVPVFDENKQSVYFTSDSTNKFGYGLDFNKSGKYKNLEINFNALALHLVELHKSALRNNIEIERVIFAPEFRRLLFKTKLGNYLQKNLTFMKNKAWVRHDEHYHIDFAVKCK